MLSPSSTATPMSPSSSSPVPGSTSAPGSTSTSSTPSLRIPEFSVKEVNLAITADLRTLQRLLDIVGFGNTMDLALTVCHISGSEAKSLGLVSQFFGDTAAMDKGDAQVAEGIAAPCYNWNKVGVDSEQGYGVAARSGLC